MFLILKSQLSFLFNRFICSGSDDSSVRLWDFDSGEFLASNNRHEHRVLDLDFVQDSNKVRALSNDLYIC